MIKLIIETIDNIGIILSQIRLLYLTLLNGLKPKVSGKLPYLDNLPR